VRSSRIRGSLHDRAGQARGGRLRLVATDELTKEMTDALKQTEAAARS